MLVCAAAVVPMHVVTRPPLEQAAEEKITAEISRENKLIEQHKKESVDVTDRMRRLNDDDVDKYERQTIESLLSPDFQSVLLQHRVREDVATRVASLLARITVSLIDIAAIEQTPGSSIVVYFRCGSVRALYELDEMITTGFMQAAFTEIIHCLTSSTPTVDIYVKTDDFDFVLSSLTSLQDTGLFWELKGMQNLI